VSASSSVKKVAGKLAHSAREGDPPAVLAIGAESLNQAIKVGGARLSFQDCQTEER